MRTRIMHLALIAEFPKTAAGKNLIKLSSLQLFFQCLIYLATLTYFETLQCRVSI